MAVALLALALVVLDDRLGLGIWRWARWAAGRSAAIDVLLLVSTCGCYVAIVRRVFAEQRAADGSAHAILKRDQLTAAEIRFLWAGWIEPVFDRRVWQAALVEMRVLGLIDIEIRGAPLTIAADPAAPPPAPGKVGEKSARPRDIVARSLGVAWGLGTVGSVVMERLFPKGVAESSLFSPAAEQARHALENHLRRTVLPRYFEARTGVLWPGVVLGVLGLILGFLRRSGAGRMEWFLAIPWVLVCLVFPAVWAIGIARRQPRGPRKAVLPAIGVVTILAGINMYLAGTIWTPGFSAPTALPVIHTAATVLALRRMRHVPNRDGALVLEEIRACRVLLESRKGQLRRGEVPLAFALDLVLDTADAYGDEETSDQRMFPAVERLLRVLPGSTGF